MSQLETDHLEEAERRIEFVLAHPGMSRWLKNAMRTALDRDPVKVLNDLGILNTLLRARCEVLMTTAAALCLHDTPF